MSDRAAENRAGDTVRTPACLIIMDGFGLAEPGDGQRHLPCPHAQPRRAVRARARHTRLEASGEAVGLPDGSDGQFRGRAPQHRSRARGVSGAQRASTVPARDGSAGGERRAAARRSSTAAPGRRCAAPHGAALRRRRPFHERAPLRANRRGQGGGRAHGASCTAFLDGRDVPPASGAGYLDELQEVLDGLCGDGLRRPSSARCRDATSPWTATTAGSASQRAWRDPGAGRAACAMTAYPPPMRCARSYDAGRNRRVRGALRAATGGVWPTATRWCSSTSVPTGRARSPAPLWTTASTGFERPVRPKRVLRVPDRVRPVHRCAGGLPEGIPRQRACRRAGRPGASAVPHRRDREVRPRDLLPERRQSRRPRQGRSGELVASPKVATYDLQPEMSEPEVADTLAAGHRRGRGRRVHRELRQPATW